MLGQLAAVAIGGAFGASLRYMVASGFYHWLGRAFPYGTLAVNLLGSLLMGIMVEILMAQRVAIAQEYRLAILVGVFGSLTTFSTFSLETVALLQQEAYGKALLNILANVLGCLLMVWLGLLLSRVLLWHAQGMLQFQGLAIPYALLLVNILGAFLVGFVTMILLEHIDLTLEYRAAVLLLVTGLFITLSSIYLLLLMIDGSAAPPAHPVSWLGLFAANALTCGLAIWGGVLAGECV
ncbi:MAG: fluoride efflux transporter CrcB [Methylococcales bacterium]|nr:fluoride efflux transporter CrcB [Methylococcales bacterium]